MTEQAVRWSLGIGSGEGPHRPNCLFAQTPWFMQLSLAEAAVPWSRPMLSTPSNSTVEENHLAGVLAMPASKGSPWKRQSPLPPRS